MGHSFRVPCGRSLWARFRLADRRTCLRIAATVAVTVASSIDVSSAQQIDPDFWGTDGQVNAVAVSGNSVYVGGAFNSVAPVTGGGVPLSARTGTPVSAFPKVDGFVYATVPDGMGGWFIGGWFRHVAGLPRDNIAHVLADGTVADWAPGLHDNLGGQYGAYAYALARRGNTLYVGGFFLKVGQVRRVDLAAVDAITGELKPWDPEPSGFVSALLVEGNTLYVGGKFYGIAGRHRAYIAAFDATSDTLTGWDPVANSGVSALAAAGTTLYAGGDFTAIGGAARSHLAALDTGTGTVLPWDPSPDAEVVSIAATEHTVYVAGGFLAVGGQPRRGIAALDAASGLATAWNTSVAFQGVNGMALDGGTLYATGGYAVAALDAASGATQWQTYLKGVGVAVSTAHGGAEVNRQPGGWGHEHRRSDLGAVFLGGEFSSVGERTPRACLAAFDLRTGALTPWAPRADGTVYALAAGGGSLWAGGQFTTINGQPHVGLVALDLKDGAPAAPSLETDGYVHALAERGERLYVGGRFAHLGGMARSNLGAVDLRTGVVPTWDPAVNDAVIGFALDGSTLYVGGLFTQAKGSGSELSPRGHAAAFDAVTGELLPWDPRANDWVGTLVPEARRIYLGGGFSRIADEQRPGLAAMDRMTGTLDSWNPWLSDYDDRAYVSALAVAGGEVYVGGRFQFLVDDWRYDFGVVDAVTGGLGSWDPQSSGPPYALVLSGNTMYVGGVFHTLGGYPCDNFAAIRLGGAVPSAGPIRAAATSLEAGTVLALACAPNPSRMSTVLRFTLPDAAGVTLRVYDLAGRRVASLLESGSLRAGAHEIPLDTRGWRPGVYLCRIEADGRSMTRRMLILR